MALVSVIIPTYNRADLVCEAVDSVLAQSYQDFEIIVVDDASTDDTCSRLSQYPDKRLRVIQHEKNEGQGQARNTGILASRGEYAAFLDADDLWEPDKLKEQMRVFEKDEGLCWTYTYAYAFDTETRRKLYSIGKAGSQYTGNIARKLFMEDFLVTSTVIAKRRIFDLVGLFTDLRKAQDWEMWLRIAAKYRIKRVPRLLVAYRLHSGMVTKNQNPLFIYSCHVNALQSAVKHTPELYADLMPRAMSMQSINAASRLLSQGNLKEARRKLINSTEHYADWPKIFPMLVATLTNRKIVLAAIKLAKKLRTGRAHKLSHLYSRP